MRAVELRLRQHERRLALLPGGGARADDGHLVVHVLDGAHELETRAARLPRPPAAHVRVGHDQLGLRDLHRRLPDGDLHPVRLRVELDEHVAFLDAVVVLHEHAGHLPGHARRDEGDVAVHVGVIGGNGVQRVEDFRQRDEQEHRQQREGSDELPRETPRGRGGRGGRGGWIGRGGLRLVGGHGASCDGCWNAG